jgi:hypothetical protein
MDEDKAPSFLIREKRFERTFLLDLAKNHLQIIDSGEQYLDMQYELLCHPYRIKIVPAAHMPQHVTNAGCTALLERG